ncbi:MAG TPA: anti-sigma factor [Stellaceae bacterium]|jgi:anti-sigma-K factor RskA|nr:anti-sigma factor [Stellaceae bacterium]
MNYTDPALRDRLAAEYVLGTMPLRARRRFERLIAAEPALGTVVAAWNARFAPLDEAAPAETPPARVWDAIVRRLPPEPMALRDTSAGGWLTRLAFWRGLALTASAAFAALLLYVALEPQAVPATVVAVLTDKAGTPAWIALRGGNHDNVRVSAIRTLPEDQKHAYELWGIAGSNAPHPLGLLSRQPDKALTLPDTDLPAGTVLAVSVEPPSGSPTGLPTGPVLYQGKLLSKES